MTYDILQRSASTIYSHPVPSPVSVSFVRLKFRELATHCCPKTRERQREREHQNRKIIAFYCRPRRRGTRARADIIIITVIVACIISKRSVGVPGVRYSLFCWRAMVFDLLRDGWIIQDIVLGFKHGGKSMLYSTYLCYIDYIYIYVYIVCYIDSRVVGVKLVYIL